MSLVEELNKVLESLASKDEFALRVTEIPKLFNRIKKQLDKVADLPPDLFDTQAIQKDLDKVKQELDNIWQKFKEGDYEK